MPNGQNYVEFYSQNVTHLPDFVDTSSILIVNWQNMSAVQQLKVVYLHITSTLKPTLNKDRSINVLHIS